MMFLVLLVAHQKVHLSVSRTEDVQSGQDDLNVSLSDCNESKFTLNVGCLLFVRPGMELILLDSYTPVLRSNMKNTEKLHTFNV